MNYETAISANKQVYDAAPGQARLQAAAPQGFRSPHANQHMADVYRGAGQKAAVDLGRQATQAQNAYYMSAKQAQDQSVLAGLRLLGQQQANQYEQDLANMNMRYGVLKGLL